MFKQVKNDGPDPLMEELVAYSRKGVRLCLQGRPCSPGKIAKTCRVAETKTTYMRDYISDAEGNITVINFTRVKTKQ